MRSIAIVAIIIIGLPVAVALARYGSLQPCDMLATEGVRLHAKSYGARGAPGLAKIDARIAFAHRSSVACLVALWRAFTQDPVDVMWACMHAELGQEIYKEPTLKVAAADKKCSSLGWYLWREAPSP